MVSLNDGGRQAVVGVARQGYLTGSGRTRLATELFNGRFRSRKSVQLREIAVEFELDDESVLRACRCFRAPIDSESLTTKNSERIGPEEDV